MTTDKPNFSAEIQELWKLHSERPPADINADLDRLAVLVVTPADACAFTRFVNHFVGGEQRDWARAVRLGQIALVRVDTSGELAGALADLTVALYLAGKEDEARDKEEQIWLLGSEKQTLPVLRRIALQVCVFKHSVRSNPETQESLSKVLDKLEEIEAPSSVASRRFESTIRAGRRAQMSVRALRRFGVNGFAREAWKL